MFKILAVNSLISAYVMSLLFLKGLRQGDTQLVILGLIIAAFFYCVSQSAPCVKLASYRPPSRLFSLPLVTSVLAQFALHMGCLLATIALCEPFIEEGEGGALFALASASSAANGSSANGTVNGTVNGSVNGTVNGTAHGDEEVAFKATIFNTCVWLISALMQVNTFAVNSRGYPFMQDFWRNKKLLYCTIAAYVLIVITTAEILPFVNDFIELVPLPSESFRLQLMAIFAIDIVGVFALERAIELTCGNGARKGGA